MIVLAAALAMKLIPSLAGTPPTEAVKWRQEAQRFQQGRGGIAQDYRKAYQRYCKAALAGDSESAFNLGWLHLNGQGVTRHPGRARMWFERASQTGNPFGDRMAFRLRDVAAEPDPSCRQPPPVGTIATVIGPVRLIRPSNRQIETLVQQAAGRYALDPQLVLAVMQAESGFNPGAMSPKNAQGLMQLIPATAERFGVKNAWDPAENIRGGAAYLHWLMRHFSGNVQWVLAAYNAGEQSVERYKGIPPYAETQAYVRKILSHYGKLTHPVPPERPIKTAL
jgi:hypothetical protein